MRRVLSEAVREGDAAGVGAALGKGADGKLSLTSEDGDGAVVKAGAKYELLPENKMGEVLMATPAISDGMIIVRGLRHVYGIGAPVRLRARR